MVPCPRCQTSNPPGARACSSCGMPIGASTTMMMNAPLPAKRPKVSLKVVRADGGAESAYAMAGEAMTCGRQAELPLGEDPFVAGVQARFFFSGTRLAIEDVAGGNGVFVRLRQERELTPGGELRIGRQRLVVEPIPAVVAGPGGVTAWGSPDPGYRFRLVSVLEGGARGAAYPLKEGENTVGRDAGDVTFPGDGFVSGRHALLQVHGPQLRVKDLGSSNGTFIRLGAATFVEQGDQFLIGRELVRVELQ